MYKLIFVGLAFIFYSCTGKTEHAKLTFLLKGNEAFEEGNLDKAVFYYNEAILTDSTYVDAYLNNALVLEAKGEYYGAIEMYDAVIKLNLKNKGALFKRANLYLDVDQYYRALDDLSVLEKSWQDSAVLYFTKGLINTKLKRYEVAISEFKHSLQLDKNQPQAFINIGNVFYYQNKLDSAIWYLKKGLKLDNTEANGYNTLSLVAIKKANYVEAVAFLNYALKIDKSNPWYLNNKGFVYLKLGKLDSAEYLINTSLKADPYNAWVYRNKGLLELQKDNLPKAIKLLEKAYKMDKTIDDLAIDLANVYIKMGEKDKSCSLLKSVTLTEEIDQLLSKYCL
ncbi:MAG: tetratricopeptide repeat protein [Cyclobacteriaceae bacterium]|nr:tetratricopeptide repeat protein [Cyclobacteriaceae bacterium]